MKLPPDFRLPSAAGHDEYTRRLVSALEGALRQISTAVNERVTAEENGSRVDAQPSLNFVGSGATSVAVSSDPANGRVTVTVSS